MGYLVGGCVMDIDNDIVMRETEAMHKICEHIWDNYMQGDFPKCTVNGFTGDLHGTDRFKMSIADSETFPLNNTSCVQINMSDRNIRNRIILLQYPEGVRKPTSEELKNVVHKIDDYFKNVCASDYVDNLVVVAGEAGKPMPFGNVELEKMTDLVIASQNTKEPTCVSYMLAEPNKMFTELDKSINSALTERYERVVAERERLSAEQAARQSYINYLDNFSISHKPDVKSAKQVEREVMQEREKSLKTREREKELALMKQAKEAYLMRNAKKTSNIKATNQYNSLDR